MDDISLLDILSKPNCSITNTSFNGYTCSLFAVLSWRSVPSDRNATIYNVKQNGVVSETSRNILSHLYKFSRISPEFGYTLSLSAEDCAGESEDDTCYFIPGNILNKYSIVNANETGIKRNTFVFILIPVRVSKRVLDYADSIVLWMLLEKSTYSRNRFILTPGFSNNRFSY